MSRIHFSDKKRVLPEALATQTFIAHLSTDLSTLTASTFLGGSRSREGVPSLALAADGSVYVAGHTLSSDFPTTIGAYDSSHNGESDIFIAHLSADLSMQLESTFLGGSDSDYNPSLALAADGSVYVVGETRSTDFPTTSGVYDSSHDGYTIDILIALLSADLSTLSESTFLGGRSYENVPILALAVDGSVYVAGATSSPDFPTTSGAYDPSYNGNSDIFISHIDKTLSECPTWYLDNDIDGYGDSNSSTVSCTQPVGYVADDNDCDDSNLDIYPGAAEICDGQDNDCDGTVPVNEVDSDNDGTLNCSDNCPADFTKIEPGTCGCGVADTDTDGDGIADCNDGCPADLAKIEPGACGCGVADTDTDGDGIPDCNEPCIDPGDSELIIDNGDAGTSSTGNWLFSGGVDYYGTQSRYSKTAGGTYTYEAALNGNYELSLWWTWYASRCDSVPVEIYDNSTLIDSLTVNQQEDESQWNVLGSYNFNGTASVVITAHGSSCSTNADAVRFIATCPPELDHIVIEGEDTVDENSTVDYALRAYYSDGSSQRVEAGWSVTCPAIAGISLTGLLTTLEVDLDETCTVVATYEDETTSLDVTIIDLVALDELIIDNGDPETSFQGTWLPSGGADYYGTTSLYSKKAHSTYKYETPLSGNYELSLRWTGWPSRCSNVPVIVYDGATPIATLAINQQEGASQWNTLGNYTFTDTGAVMIVSQGSCSTNADAVRFIRSSPPELDHIEIEGLATVNENSTANYIARAYYLNDTSRLVDTLWNVNCPSLADISSSGLLTTYAVDQDEACTVSTSYTEGAVTVTDDLAVTINNSVEPPTSIIIDNNDAETFSTGDWPLSSGANYYGTQSRYSKTVRGTYNYTTALNGEYGLSLWWTEWPSRCTDVQVMIYDNDTPIDTVVIDQQANGGKWNFLGNYSFSGTGRLTIVSQGSCSTNADAVMFTENP